MITAALPVRGQDAHGSGAYGASRGSREHRGIDYAVLPGSRLKSPVRGSVTKVGYPYADDLSFRYVQVTNARGFEHRFFYIEPTVTLGDWVDVGDELGVVQDLLSRYPGITPHVHVELKDHDGNFMNPSDL